MSTPSCNPPTHTHDPASETAVRVIAHRGDTESTRENTLAAIAAAVRAGATDIEIDVRTTADRVPVLLHDPTTLRLWGRAVHVGEQTLAQLRQLGSGDPAGSGTRIPTLVDVLDLLTSLDHAPRLVIDTRSPEDATTAWTTLRRHSGAGKGHVRVEWCGVLASLEAIRELDADAVLQVDHPGGDFDVDTAQRLGAELVNVDFSLLTPGLIEQVHAAGLQISTWTLNSAEQMSWAIDAGVDGITTDRPRLLRELVTNGYSPLALTWAGPEQLASRTALPLEQARWVSVARELAEWVIGFTRTTPLGSIETKAHAADVVTEVDRAVERHVREVIAHEFPEHVVVGEEYGGEPVEGRPVWYLDPVDGTTNLANHLPWTAMSLALAIDGEPVVAVVAQPWSGEVYLAVRGLGATLDGRPLQLGRVESLQGRVVMTETSAHEFWDGQVEFMQRLGEQHCTTRLMGSGTLTLTRIASGNAVAGLVPRFHPIDHLAGALVTSEAGARVLNSDGGDSLFPTEGGMLVAAPGAAEKLWPLWQPNP